MAVLPRTATPVSATTLAPLLADGLASRIGRTPVRELALLLLAQLWTENARGNPIQNNLGNLSAGGYIHGDEVIKWKGDLWRPSWFDQASIDAVPDLKKRAELQARHDQMLGGEIPSAFRAYSSVSEGLAAYLDLLFRPIYQPLLAAAATGDPLAFATEIKSHYNPDKHYDPVATSHTFASLVQEFNMKGLFDFLPKGEPAPPAPVPSPLPSGSVWVLSPSDVAGVSPAARAARVALLERGISGALVAVWQTLLNLRLTPTPALEITGLFDVDTDTLTKAWQIKNGLKNDGRVGPLSWARMIG